VLTELAASRPASGFPAPTDGADGADDPRPSAGRPPPATRTRRTTPVPSRPIQVSDADDPQEAPRG
jgi:hypothetical protein